MKTLTIGIVTYNHAEYIGRVLCEIDRHIASRVPTRIIVWDNGSEDGTRDLVKNWIPDTGRQSGLDIELIQSDVNLGFGQAHNEILRCCSSDYHLIYNPDLYATPNCLQPLLDELNSDPEVMIVAPKFLYPDGKLQPLCRRDPSLLDLFLRFFAVGPFRKIFNRYLKYKTLQDTGYSRIMNVPIASGAMMCLRTDDFKKLNGFDNRFFVYFEDYDLCRRVRHEGKKIRYTPHSIFIHEWRRESRRSLRAVRLLFSGAWIYFRKWGFRFA